MSNYGISVGDEYEWECKNDSSILITKITPQFITFDIAYRCVCRYDSHCDSISGVRKKVKECAYGSTCSYFSFPDDGNKWCFNMAKKNIYTIVPDYL